MKRFKFIILVLGLILAGSFNLARADGTILDQGALLYGHDGSEWQKVKTDSNGKLDVVGTVTTTASHLSSTTDSVEVKQATGTNLHTVVDSGSVNVGTVTTLPAITGTVTANAGTNLNTSTLATETTLAKLVIAQAAALGANTMFMAGAAVLTGNPTYTTGTINPLSMAIDGTLRTRTDLNPGSSILSGQKNVTTAGTEVVLGNSAAILSVTVKAKVGNTGSIYVGPTGSTSSTTGFVLSKGEAITYDTDNITDVYINSSVNGEGVTWTTLVK